MQWKKGIRDGQGNSLLCCGQGHSYAAAKVSRIGRSSIVRLAIGEMHAYNQQSALKGEARGLPPEYPG